MFTSWSRNANVGCIASSGDYNLTASAGYTLIPNIFNTGCYRSIIHVGCVVNNRRV